MKFKVYRPEAAVFGKVVVKPEEEMAIDNLVAYPSEETGVVSYHVNFKTLSGFIVVARDDQGYWSDLAKLFSAEMVDTMMHMYVLAASEVRNNG